MAKETFTCSLPSSKKRANVYSFSFYSSLSVCIANYNTELKPPNDCSAMFPAHFFYQFPTINFIWGFFRINLYLYTSESKILIKCTCWPPHLHKSQKYFRNIPHSSNMKLSVKQIGSIGMVLIGIHFQMHD